MKVKNMTSAKGNDVPNQFIIEGAIISYKASDDHLDGDMFQSYDSNIAFIGHYDSGDKIVLLDKTYWDYSVTTGKYRNQFLGEGIAETRKKIASGEYKLVDLN